MITSEYIEAGDATHLPASARALGLFSPFPWIGVLTISARQSLAAWASLHISSFKHLLLVDGQSSVCKLARLVIITSPHGDEAI